MKTRCSALRWGVVAFISLGVIVNYLARNALAVLAPQLEAALRFGTKEYSYVVAAFQLAYTVMQPVCGFIMDRMGTRAGLALFGALWSVFSALHGLASTWPSLALLRAGLGASEAAAVPGGMKVAAEWFSGPDRSRAVGWFNVGTSLGAMLAPPLTVGLTLAYGWRSAFVAIGALGAIWSLLWFAVYRPPPSTKPIGGKGSRDLGLGFLTQRRFWALAVPRFLAEPAWQTFNFWVPIYLAADRHWDLERIALFAWAPFLAADLGGVASGYLSPFLSRLWEGKLLRARATVVWVGAILMIAPGCVALSSDPIAAMALLCVGGFAHQTISVTINALSADLFSSDELGAANGWVGSAGWCGGLAFSLIIGQVVRTTGFGPLFACLGAFDILGAIILARLLRGLNPISE